MKRYSLYIDESGSGNLTDYSYNNLLLTGIIIEEIHDIEISAYFNYIKKIYKLSEYIPFHSYDLFENSKSKSYLPLNKAVKLINSLTEFIKIIPVKASIYNIDKTKLRFFFGMKGKNDYFSGSEESERWKEIPYEILSSKMFFWFADNLTANSEHRGAIVAESRKEADHALLRSYLRCKTPSQHNSQNMRSASEKMQKRISSIRFEGKIGFWPGLEIADLFSYTAYQVVNKKIRSKHFRDRKFTNLWHAIEKKIYNKKINVATNHTFKTYIPSSRVNKISNKVKQINNKPRESELDTL
jgi:hypothetical protein